MSLRDRIPVEPLAPERWGHLEQRVVAHAGDALARPAPRRWWPVLAAAGVAAAVAIAAVGLRAPAPAAPASMIVSADLRGAHVDLGDAVIDAEPGTRFVVTRPDGGVRIALASGAVSLEVAPRRERPPLWVIAGDVSVRVVGTAFTVRRDPDVTVTVSHGVVEVDRAGAPVAVRAGQRWSTTGGVVAVATADADADADAAAGAAGAAGRIATAPVGPDTLDLTGDPDVELLGPRKGGIAPPVPRDGAGSGSSRGAPGTNRGAASAAAGVSTGSQAGAATRPTLTPAAELRAAIAAQSILAAPPTTATSPADAIAAYQRELVTARGAAAAAALWGLARTQWAQGKSADALRSLDAYVRRFTSGAETDAVLWLRLRLLCTRALDDTCRAAAHTYATRAADGRRRDLAVLATQTR